MVIRCLSKLIERGNQSIDANQEILLIRIKIFLSGIDGFS